MSDFCITKTDVLREILKFDDKKSDFNSEIPTKVIKKIPETFTNIFYTLFNLILKFNAIPTDLKIVSVFPIFKKGKPYHQNSYRPVSVEKNILKLFTKLFFNNISGFLSENSI